MDWKTTVFEVIDMRSFSNLWFWIALAVTWSSVSHRVIGVPWDLIQRAARDGGEAFHDLQSIVRVNVNRTLYVARQSGLWLIGFLFFMLTSLALLGFEYRIEFAQAVFLIALPLSLVGVLSVATCQKIEGEGVGPETLFIRLRRHRSYTQLIGMASIFVTALYGMYQNLNAAFGF